MEVAWVPDEPELPVGVAPEVVVVVVGAAGGAVVWVGDVTVEVTGDPFEVVAA